MDPLTTASGHPSKRVGIPLVRTEGGPPGPGAKGVAPHDLVMDPRLLRAHKTARTRQAEAVLALGDCLYFYVGHACSDFGDMVFVYDPAMSSAWPGSATRFDTGGVIGYIHADGLPSIDDAKRSAPEKLSDEEKRVFHEYVHRHPHRMPLKEWHAAFQDFVKTYYKTPGDYVLGQPPDPMDATDRHQAPNGRRAWTWEIQAHQDHDVFTGLWLLCLRPDRYNELRKLVRKNPGLPAMPQWKEALQNRDLVPAIPSPNVWAEAERRITEWL